METLKYIPILIFKQQGEEANDLCSFLDKNDFLLVIQTEFQRDMLKKYGNRGICIDATYKVNDFDFHLITILVLEDFQEGIPVAWALANREYKISIVHILHALREQSGSIMAGTKRFDNGLLVYVKHGTAVLQCMERSVSYN